MFEQRKYPRVPVGNSVHIKLYRVEGDEALTNRTLFCRTADVSLMGIRLRTPVQIPMDTRLSLRVAISDPPSTFVHSAVVRWSGVSEDGDGEQFDVGVEFTTASDEVMQDWEDVVEHLGHLHAAAN